MTKEKAGIIFLPVLLRHSGDKSSGGDFPARGQVARRTPEEAAGGTGAQTARSLVPSPQNVQKCFVTFR